VTRVLAVYSYDPQVLILLSDEFFLQTADKVSFGVVSNGLDVRGTVVQFQVRATDSFIFLRPSARSYSKETDWSRELPTRY
jgi:hypothetical protein